MRSLHQEFKVSYRYTVTFTRDIFAPENPELARFFAANAPGGASVLAVIDGGVLRANCRVAADMADRLASIPGVRFVGWGAIPGGEEAKRGEAQANRIRRLIHRHGVCRHSYLLAVGGGAVLDAAGYAAATAHRGVRLIRVPSTVLAQNDAGVGVKNGVNLFGSKNFAGTFAPPAAIFNDSSLLSTLHPRDARSGIAEGVKVALIRDASFFDRLWADRHLLHALDRDALEEMIFRCADLHLRHIRAGDPFETGSARPLDFGHWSAHRLEELTGGELRHGEAVAIGIALDSLYAARVGLLHAEQADAVLQLLGDCGLAVSHPALRSLDVARALEDFRRHLGGPTTITLPAGIGKSVDVHSVDVAVMQKCIMQLLEGEKREHTGAYRGAAALVA